MIRHIVLWKWRPSVSPAEISRALAELDSLAGQVQGVHDLHSVENLAANRPAGEGFTHCTLSLIEDEAAMRAWQQFPPHLSWGERYVFGDSPQVKKLISLDVLES